MKRSCLAILCALFCVSPLMAFQDEPAAKAPDESMTAYTKLVTDYDEKMAGFRKKYKAAENKEARNELYQTDYPEAADYAVDLMKIVKEHAGSRGAFSAAKWVTLNDRGEHGRNAFEILANDFVTAEGIGAVCLRKSRDLKPMAYDFLRNVMAKNSHATDQGRACFALAGWYKNALSTLNRLESITDKVELQRSMKYYGEETVTKLKAMGKESLQKKCLAHFARVKAEFSEVGYRGKKTLGMAADAVLFELNNLQIGKTSPDITAEDIDGVEFSLSDYRGKVVVLDFWGDW